MEASFTQITQFGNAFLFIIIGVIFTVVGFLTAKLLRPSRPNDEKLSSYECGEEAVGSSWVQFNIRFYVVALIFILFDVEVVFLFPWATVFKEFGVYGFVTGFIFMFVLIIGMLYEWKKGDLEWVRPEPTIPSLELNKEIKAKAKREMATPQVSAEPAQ